MQLIDIGCNLASKSLYKNAHQIITTAKSKGVARQIITGSDLDSNEKGLALADSYSELSSTIGFHPHHAQHWQPHKHPLMLQMAGKSANCVAMGEMGLDYYRNLSSPAQQKRCFNDQLEIAVDLAKPVFLHVRAAVSDFQTIIKPYLNQLSGTVWHCFTESKAALLWAIDHEFSIGITGWICDPIRGANLREIVKYIPNQQLMIETDAPYLSPKTLKPTPRINEPQYLHYVLAQLAESRGQNIDELAAITYQNSLNFFHLESTLINASTSINH